jgi:hypothetical protein
VSLISLKIHDEHRQRVARTKRVGHCHLEPVLEQRPVRQIRQAVVIREVANAFFGLGALAPHLRIAQLAVDGGNETREVVLDDVVVGAVFHRLDGNLFANRARHEDERHLEPAVAHHCQRGGPAESRHRVIGDDQIPVVAIELFGKCLGVVDASAVGLVAALAQVLDQEQRVGFGVLNQQEAERFHELGATARSRRC